MQPVRFTNFTSEDFTHSYDGIPMTIKSGETMLMEDFRANLFAKHLVVREMNRLGFDTSNVMKFEEFKKLCFTEPLKEEIVEEVIEKKKGRPKKVELQEFIDLKE